MSVTVQQLTQTPEALAEFPDESAGPWFVLHTRGRHEKRLSNALGGVGIRHFLPMIDQTKRYGSRKAVVHAPVFPGYLFLRGSWDDCYVADRTRHVARILPVPDQRQLDMELRNLHLALCRGVPLVPHPFLERGTRVEVRSGPLRGLQGIVESAAGGDRLVLQVLTLGRAVSMEIDLALLNIVGRP